MISRRTMIAGSALAVAGSWPLSRVGSAAEKSFLPEGLPEGVYDTATLEALPGKKPLIKLTYRPPNYETPLSHFTSEVTPNDSFFVRYHLAGIPEDIDAAKWKLKVGGEGVGKPLELSLSELRSTSRQRTSPQSANVRAIVAAFRSRTWREWNGDLARSAMRCGEGRGSRRC
jgi:DMSO/TMAO reductase YedYZ molybdopterin-dependent catalytic subunit